MLKNKFEIVQANENDLPDILALQKTCYQQEAEIYNDYQIAPLTQTLESLNEDFQKQTLLKMQSGNNVIGSVRAYAENDICKIGRLIVHKDHQNQGLGKQLMKAIELQFAFVNRFELFTGDKSLKNIALYNKLGYNEFKRHGVNNRLELVFLEKVNI